MDDGTKIERYQTIQFDWNSTSVHFVAVFGCFDVIKRKIYICFMWMCFFSDTQQHMSVCVCVHLQSTEQLGFDSWNMNGERIHSWIIWNCVFYSTQWTTSLLQYQMWLDPSFGCLSLLVSGHGWLFDFVSHFHDIILIVLKRITASIKFTPPFSIECKHIVDINGPTFIFKIIIIRQSEWKKCSFVAHSQLSIESADKSMKRIADTSNWYLFQTSSLFRRVRSRHCLTFLACVCWVCKNNSYFRSLFRSCSISSLVSTTK